MKANDQLAQYCATDSYHKYMMGLVLTDGALAMAEKFECFWLLDIIASYQYKVRGWEFQVWTFKKSPGTDSGTVKCTDGNDTVLVKQNIPYTDLKADEAELWVEGNVILLPSEH